MYSCLNLLLLNQFHLKCYYDLGNNGKKIFQEVCLSTKCRLCFCLTLSFLFLSEFITIFVLLYSWSAADAKSKQTHKN